MFAVRPLVKQSVDVAGQVGSAVGSDSESEPRSATLECGDRTLALLLLVVLLPLIDEVRWLRLTSNGQANIANGSKRPRNTCNALSVAFTPSQPSATLA